MEAETDMTKLGNLLEGIVDERTLAPLRERRVSGLFDDSRNVLPDGLFVALRGSAADGRVYVDDALRRGAAVVLGEGLSPAAGAAVLNVTDARAALARMASRWYGLEGERATTLKVLGVTGTNGKTTTTHMTQRTPDAAARR